jgi:hypothetical protein
VRKEEFEGLARELTAYKGQFKEANSGQTNANLAIELKSVKAEIEKLKLEIEPF